MDIISQQKIVNKFGILLTLAGFGLVVFQIFHYLKNGQWIELPLLLIAAYGPDKFVSWLGNPASWIGLHKIIYNLLNFTPLSLTMVFVGIWLIIEVESK